MFQYTLLAAFLVFSVTFLFSQCRNPLSAATNQPTVEPTDFNYSVTLDNTPEIRITGSAFEVSTNNCGNPVSAIETFSKSREFNISVELGLTEAVIGEVGGGVAKVAEAKLGAQIEANLKIDVGSVEKFETSRQIETPPDSRTTITLQWEELWAKGNISVRRADDTLVGDIPFFALTTINLSQKKVETVNCGTVVPTLPAALSEPPTPVVIEQPTISVPPSDVNTSAKNECISSPYTFVANNSWSGHIREETSPGTTKTYSHCPPQTAIRYDDVAVDDELLEVKLVCPDSTTTITQSFQRVDIPGEQLPHYRSGLISLASGCRIDFIVKDIAGGGVGVTFRANTP